MIYFDEYGDKANPTILLLHGAMAVHTFTQQYELLRDFHVVVPHLPGAGESVSLTYDAEVVTEQLLQLVKSLNKSKIYVMGHSIGAQLAVRLVSNNPELFTKAIFLSAWVIPNEKSIRLYCKSASFTIGLLRYKWLMKLQAKYWRHTKEQGDYMVAYAPNITVENYQQFFKQTLDLSSIPQYFNVDIPMLAICGDRESKGMKASLQLLSKNKACHTMILPKAAHDFPMRCAKRLNPMLKKFFRS